ncbi:MAG: GTA-gp10 family protein [Sphingomonadales bacterium]
MTSKTKPEITIKLGGKSYAMRPTFEAVRNAENALGIGFLKIAEQYFEQRLTVGEMTAVIHAAISTGKARAPAIEKVGQLLVDGGIAECVAPLGEFISDVLTDPDQEPDPQSPEEAG